MKKIIILAFTITSFFYAEAQQGLQMGNNWMNQNYLLMNGQATRLEKQAIIDYCIINGFILPMQSTNPDLLWLENLNTHQRTIFVRQKDGTWKC